MRKISISLDGVWQLAWCPLGTGSPAAVGGLRQLPCRVPGDVHAAFIEAGLITEPLCGTADLDCRWLEEQEFWYQRRFFLRAEELCPMMRLTFEGLDCTADVWLNGTFLGRHSNAFVEAEWDAAGLLCAGENLLLLRLDDGLAEAKTHDLEQMGCMWNNEQPWRVWMRKPQFVWGWDWTHWVDTCGIWRSVRLTGWDDAVLTDVYARCGAAREGQPCAVSVSVELEGRAGVSRTLRCAILDRDGRTVAETSLPVSGARADCTLTVPSARLWWCAGMGEAYLYTVRAVLTDSAGAVLDQRSRRLGLRTAALAEPPLENGETGFTFLLNGEPVFCKGANHVPCDCLPGRITAEKERALVAMARDAHMNMLRIWGGGVYASDALMDACDEAGIMVWHDFMFACGYYPGHDPAFAAAVASEARRAVRRLRGHPCLIGWAGNNEIQEMYLCQKQWQPDLPWYGGSIYEELLPEITAELCPELIYRASSPLGGERQADPRHGDQHYWLLTHVDSDPHFLDLWHFTDLPAKFLSEFGVIGAMTLETARQCIPAEHLSPGDPVWLHHTNSTRDHRLPAELTERAFGPCDSLSAARFTLRSQALQAEVTRHIYEEYRRRKFRCSGLLFWTLSDSMGIHNWSLIDYGLRRKPVYHALKRAMAPLALCLRGFCPHTAEGESSWRAYWAGRPDPVEIWGLNDTLRDVEAFLCWTLLTPEGDVLAEERLPCVLPANRSVLLRTVPIPGPAFDPARAVLRARLWADGALLNETRYFFAPLRRMAGEPAAVEAAWKPEGIGRYRVSLRADRFAWLLHLSEPDGTAYEDNDFDLWPGETREVIASTGDTDFVPRFTWMNEEEAP